MAILGNKEEIDFVVHNYPAVMAVVEALEDTKRDLPIWLTKRISARCKQAEELISAIDLTWDIENTNDQVLIYPSDEYFAAEEEYGLYYGVENITWDALISNETDDDGPWIYLYFDLPNRLKKDWVDWKVKVLNAASIAKKQLTQKGYSVLPDKKDNYIIKLYIADKMNLTHIRENVDEMIDEIIKMLVQAISDTRKLLIKIPQ